MSVLNSFRLDDRVAVVTGGNRGLGEAFARALGEAGARVAIAARDDTRTARVASELDALPVTADVTDPDSVKAMVGLVTAELGPIDVLVNNAGVCFHRPALEVPADEWRRSGTSTLKGSGIVAGSSAPAWSSADRASSSTSDRSRP